MQVAALTSQASKSERANETLLQWVSVGSLGEEEGEGVGVRKGLEGKGESGVKDINEYEEPGNREPEPRTDVCCTRDSTTARGADATAEILITNSIPFVTRSIYFGARRLCAA